MTLMLIDGNNLYYRAWFASQNKQLSAEGTPTGPLVVFMGTLSSLVRDLRPTKLGVCWDGGRSAFRTQVRPSYKANRDNMDYSVSLYNARTLVQSALALHGVPQICREGYEADDVMAGFWEMAEEPVQIVSNDKDLTQLCGPNPQGHKTVAIRLSSAGTGTEKWGAEEVEKHYGCEPSNLHLLMALMGDSADNIEGIPGIGPKRALKILQESEFNAIQMFQHPKVAEHAELVRSNMMLIGLRRPLAGMKLRPIKEFDPVRPGHQDWEELEKFLKKYQLSQIRHRLNEGRFWQQPDNTFG